MNSARQLLDALIRHRGERLVIRGDEPPFIWRDEKKGYLTRAPLKDDMIRKIDEELEEVFAGKEWLVYSGQEIGRTNENGAIHIQMASALPEVLMRKQAGATDAPALADLNALLRLMVERKASDLHLGTDTSPLLRVDGEIVPAGGPGKLSEPWLRSELEAIMPERNRGEFERSQDTDFAHEVPGLARFRVNVFSDQRGLGAVLRFIPAHIIPAADLNIPQPVIDLLAFPKGLILVTGPTGSGKSTTLASLIDHINSTRAVHIITIEDPVEFIHASKLSLVNQREVGTHTESFKKALRAALREDPDVILVGEMRDLETIAIAVEMAATGHLVLGTLHTSTACGTVDRIIDQFPADQQNQIRSMLADALIGVVSQMLCRRPEGGRVAAYEVMVVNVAVANLIREGKTFQIPAMMQTGKALGNRLLNDSLADLVEKDGVTVDEALSKAVEKEALRSRLRSRSLLAS